MKKKLKKHLSTIILGIIFFAGLAIFLYPSVSNYINSKRQSGVVANYTESIQNLTEEDYTALWAEAEAYNAELATRTTNLNLTDEQLEEYYSIFDPLGTGIMGHLEIENIGVDLPIYHGTDENVLQVGIGHIPGTSLPAGGTGTHAVLSGHRGLPSSKLLSDLDQMVVGDTFLLHILDETLAYQVDQILIVLPEETESLAIDPDEDYVTLVTCTPYGVNTHRMLVRGHRIDYSEAARTIITADATKLSAITVAPFIAAPILIILLLIVIFVPNKKKR